MAASGLRCQLWAWLRAWLRTYCAHGWHDLRDQGGLPFSRTHTEIRKLVRLKPHTSGGLGHRVVLIQVLPALSRHQCLFPAEPQEDAYGGLRLTAGSISMLPAKAPKAQARGSRPTAFGALQGPSLGLPGLRTAAPVSVLPLTATSDQLQPRGCWHRALALPSQDCPREPPPAGCARPLTAPWWCGDQGSPLDLPTGAPASDAHPAGLAPALLRPESQETPPSREQVQPLSWLHRVPASCLRCRG